MKFPNAHSLRAAEDRAEHQRELGIPDREPIFDDRVLVDLDLRTHGGRHWQIEPRLGYTSRRLRNLETLDVEFVGTMKQVLRQVSAVLAHRLGARNLQ